MCVCVSLQLHLQLAKIWSYLVFPSSKDVELWPICNFGNLTICSG